LSRRLADELGQAGVALRRIHVWSFA